MTSAPIDINAQLRTLRRKFVDNLPERLVALRHQFEVFSQAEHPDALQTAADDIHAMAHSLKGLSASFGLEEVAELSKRIETACLIGDGVSSDGADLFRGRVGAIVGDALNRLDALAATPDELVDDSWMPVARAEAVAARTSRSSNRILLVEDDAELADALDRRLANFGFDVSIISTPDDLPRKVEDQRPSVIVMDIMFEGDRAGGLKAVRALRDSGNDTPVVFVSARDDFAARLEAVRNGGDSYIVKPVNLIELVEILHRLLGRELTTPYRVLMVDDEAVALDIYSTVLEQDGFVTATFSDPEAALAALDAFEPDVVVADVKMGDFNGFELANVIRQTKGRFSRVPIVFLTSEDSQRSQLLAIRSGGDDLVKKGANHELLLSSVRSRAERFRDWHIVAAQREEHDEKFQAASRSAAEAIVSFSADRVITYWNPSAERIFALSEEQSLGEQIDRIIPNRHFGQFLDMLSASENDSSVNEGTLAEIEACRSDGSEFPAEISISRWSVSDTDYFTAIIRDITHRRQVESDLTESERALSRQNTLLQTAFDSIDQGFVVWDKDFKLEAWNGICVDRWLRPDNVSVGMPMRDLMLHLAKNQAFGPGDAEALADQELARLMAEGHQSTDEFQTPEGRTIVVERFPMATGGHASVYTDVTDQRLSVHELRIARDRAEAANRAKSEFLSHMSHELRTPLNAILGFAQIMQMGNIDDARLSGEKCAGEIITAGTHLLNLINEILDLARIESGQLDLDIEPVDPTHPLEDALGLVANLAERRSIHINNETRDIPTVVADQLRLKQIFINLLSNAIKYNKDAGTVTVTSIAGGTDTVRIRIADTGNGIPAERRAAIFEPFVRGTANNKVEGSGVGLTITKRLVEAMGGSIDFASEDGVGTAFWIDLPIASAEVDI